MPTIVSFHGQVTTPIRPHQEKFIKAIGHVFEACKEEEPPVHDWRTNAVSDAVTIQVPYSPMIRDYVLLQQLH